jgi:hypothetical protein
MDSPDQTALRQSLLPHPSPDKMLPARRWPAPASDENQLPRPAMTDPSVTTSNPGEPLRGGVFHVDYNFITREGYRQAPWWIHPTKQHSGNRFSPTRARIKSMTDPSVTTSNPGEPLRGGVFHVDYNIEGADVGYRWSWSSCWVICRLSAEKVV